MRKKLESFAACLSVKQFWVILTISFVAFMGSNLYLGKLFENTAFYTLFYASFHPSSIMLILSTSISSSSSLFSSSSDFFPSSKSSTLFSFLLSITNLTKSWIKVRMIQKVTSTRLMRLTPVKRPMVPPIIRIF